MSLLLPVIIGVDKGCLELVSGELLFKSNIEKPAKMMPGTLQTDWVLELYTVNDHV